MSVCVTVGVGVSQRSWGCNGQDGNSLGPVQSATEAGRDSWIVETFFTVSHSLTHMLTKVIQNNTLLPLGKAGRIY